MQKIHWNARKLRSDATDAERQLWRHLRGKQLLGFKFRRQYPIAGLIADFACPEARLVIELDGGQHLEQAEYDDARTHKLLAHGYRVLRFWDDDVLMRTTLVLEEICRQLSPHPNPPLRTGEGARSEQV